MPAHPGWASIVGAAIDPKSGGGWYRDIGGGMGQALNAAAATPGYTLSDRGTWLSFKNKSPLVVVVEGDPHLLNRYDVIELTPAKHGNAKLKAAHRLAEWLASASGQKGDRQFSGWRPAAVPSVGRTAPVK